eukprot:9469204-Pyramimonas_sp.AAC.2
MRTECKDIVTGKHHATLFSLLLTAASRKRHHAELERVSLEPHRQRLAEKTLGTETRQASESPDS